MADIEIVKEVPTPTCPKCGKPADLEARSGMWIHAETSSPRCAKGAAEAAPLNIVEQSYKLQCAALEKTVKGFRDQVAELRSEVARLEAAVKDRDAMISETLAGSLGLQEENAKLEAEVERLRLILTEAREAFNGGETSEAAFAPAVAKYLKHTTSQALRLREDVGNWMKRAESLETERDEANRLLGEMTEALNRTVDQRDSALESPVPMVLFCPECTERHIDTGEFAERPHHTHACQACGFVWRPAVVATVGVRFLPGFRDADVAVVSSRFGMSTARINGVAEAVDDKC